MFQQSSAPDIQRNISAKKPRRPHNKSRTGCRICRRRKVKCDETHPTCKNCQRRGLGAECEYAYSEVTHMMSELPIASASLIQPESDGQPPGPTQEQYVPQYTGNGGGIFNITQLATAGTGPPALAPFAAGEVGGGSLPSVGHGRSIPPGNSMPPNKHSAPIAARSMLSSTIQLPPRARDRTCASSSSPHGPMSQYSSTSIYTPTQIPSCTPSLFPFIPSTQTLHPNDLTTATLIHLFTTLTGHYCSTQRAAQRVYAVHAPRQALRLARTRPTEMGYLLYSLLAVAALHAAALSHTSGRGQGKNMLPIRRAWMKVAGVYHGLTFEGFRVAVEKYVAYVQNPGEVQDMLATLTWEDVKRVYGFVGMESGSEGEDEKTAPVLAKSDPAGKRGEDEEKQRQARQGEAKGHHVVVGRNMRVARGKVAEIFSRLDKELVDNLEAIMLTASFLMIYAVARGNLDSETSSSTTPSPPKPSAPPQGAAVTTPATSFTTDGTSTPTVSGSNPLRRPMLSWVRLLRGMPAMIRQSPIGWVIFSQGHLAPLTAGLFKPLVPDHPYAPQLAHLRHTLFTPAYFPHPKLPQPLCPMTADIFEIVIDKLTQCFARFFQGEDFLAAAMSFPATIEEKFFMGLGLGERWDEHEKGACGDDRGGVHGTARAGELEGRKDPMALVVMAYALVLLVLVVGLFPEYGEDVQVGEDICGVLGIDLMDLDDNGSDDDDDEGKFEPDSGGGDEHSTPHKLKHGNRPPPNHPSPTWWIAGVGKREITEIARYLEALDGEERWASGTEVQTIEGRWMKWMEWPLEISKNGGEDVVRALKEAVRKGK
ncbi:hypothetical protein EV426DRAFT_623172 [Tirmania nivea]|nr:hypothetical protein EV426DRAFT_623172 [Tirmania nivea]